MDTEVAVQTIADAYAEAEQKAGQIKGAVRDTKDAWLALSDNLVIGTLEAQMRFRRLDALVTAFHAELYRLHADDTARAKELGVDLPSIAGGGGR
jgi:hypothetical protein